MILYQPVSGDVYTNPINYKTRCCFIMTKIGDPISKKIINIRRDVELILSNNGFQCFDSDSMTIGKDFLMKIWKIIVSVPIGIAIIDESITAQTMANIFYEIGLMDAMGKETLIIKTKDVIIPSDFVRTEYVLYDKHFKRKVRSFIGQVDEHAVYYSKIAAQLDNNPLLSIDYYRRAYLLTGNKEYIDKANVVFLKAGVEKRAKNSVEMLLANFALDQISIKCSSQS